MAETNPFAITLDNHPFFNCDLVPTRDLESFCNELWPLVTAHLPTSRKKPHGVEYVFRSLVANFAAVKRIAEPVLLVPRNKAFFPSRSRYKPAYATYGNVRRALDAMTLAGLINQEIGTGQYKVTRDYHGDPKCVRQATRINPTAYLTERLTPLMALPVRDLAQWRESVEVIHLRDKRQDKGKASSSEQVPYSDTPTTISLRAEVQNINRHLKRHPCHYAGSHRVNLMNDHVKRIFNNGDWRQGGRLYGYWPMNLPKSERHYLCIDGEALADLDFGSCFVALLHVHDGAEFNPDAPDPFTIEGYESLRGEIKQSAYAILNAAKRMKNYPEDITLEDGSRPPLPWREMEKVIFANVPLFKRYAYTGLGLTLMRKESDILITVLTDLIERDIGLIPMHDGIMVPRSRMELTRTLMLKHYHALTGQRILIKEKSIPIPSAILLDQGAGLSHL